MVIESDIEKEHYNLVGHIHTQKLKQVTGASPTKKPPVPKAYPTSPPYPPQMSPSASLSPSSPPTSSSSTQNAIAQTMDFVPLYQFMEATILKQAQLVKHKVRVEEGLETTRHEQELLELWQTTIDAEEEAEHLETKLQLAHRIIDIHGKMKAMDEMLRKAKTCLLEALQEMKPQVFHTRNISTSISLVKNDTGNSRCTYAELAETVTNLRDMISHISSQPLVDTETTEIACSFIRSIKESTSIIEKNISEIVSIQKKIDDQKAAASEKLLQKSVQANIEAVKLQAALFDPAEI